MKTKINFKDILLILLGTTLVALSVAWFADPAKLVTGGFSGIAIIVKRLTEKYFGYGIPLGVTNFALNIPLFIIATRQRGFDFAKKSFIAVIWLSIALVIFELIPLQEQVAKNDIIIATVFSGFFSGIGLGLVLRGTSTTGGTDMLASIIKYKRPHISMSIILFTLDAIIIFSGAFIFGIHNALYAVLSVAISSIFMKYVLEGVNFAKAAFIISDKSEEISEKIMVTLDRGNTGLQARGMYTKAPKEVLYVVVSRKEVSLLVNLVKEIDPSAFITITDVREVLGEGFANGVNDLKSL